MGFSQKNKKQNKKNEVIPFYISFPSSDTKGILNITFIIIFLTKKNVLGYWPWSPENIQLKYCVWL